MIQELRGMSVDTELKEKKLFWKEAHIVVVYPTQHSIYLKDYVAYFKYSEIYEGFQSTTMKL